MYLMETNRKCIDVEILNLVDNCVKYSSTGNCNACSSDYYLVENECVSLDVSIPNCEIYNDA